MSSIDSGDLSYVYKSSVMGAPLEFHLTPDALEWRKGGIAGRTPYGSVRRIRLSFRPMTMQNYRFVTEVWPASGPKLQLASSSWKSLVEHQRLDAEYRVFVSELSRRIGAAGGNTAFDTGSPAFLYWPGVVIVIGAALALAALAVRALQQQAWGGAAFVAAFFALFLYQAGNFFRRNRPGTYRPDAIPPLLLPKSR
jgi:hypothetical protein